MGIIFIDRVNKMNNLWYCEYIAASNPCAEQFLPENGACLLGSFALPKYLIWDGDENEWFFDQEQLEEDIKHVVRAMDNVVDVTKYPHRAQQEEEENKRRMGLGFTGVANFFEAQGLEYGSEMFLEQFDSLGEWFANKVYQASSELAAEKGAFPLFDCEKYLQSEFVKTLWPSTQEMIRKNGIRNSHLLSHAPTGSISLGADNMSSGVEPVWTYVIERVRQTFDGPVIMSLEDYGYAYLGIKGKTTVECTAEEHVKVLATAQKWIDSAVSKTVNVDPNMPWDDFKDIYMKAWESGCKGCTTFNPEGERMGIMKKTEEKKEEPEEGTACYIDPETGARSCS